MARRSGITYPARCAVPTLLALLWRRCCVMAPLLPPKPQVEVRQGATLRGVVDIAIGDRLIEGLLDRQAGTRGDGRSKCPS